MSWDKRIICDVDDTISTHINRDYENAIPHTDIIEKLNSLYDSGYEIVYMTARGQLSFKGDIEKIEKYRKPVLEKWLKKHNVKYTDLVFTKPLGIYYVDDKALRPDEFMNMEYEVLHGRSCATVTRLGNRVLKTETSLEKIKSQYNWYKRCPGGVNIPAIYSIIDKTLTMEYIEGVLINSIINSSLLAKIFNIVESFRIMKEGPIFNSYIDRIRDHMSVNNIPHEDEILDRMYLSEEYFNKNRSFCHGDLTLNNMILTRENDIYVIDPNPPKEVYTSWLLDVAKLYQSIHYDYENLFFDYPKNTEKESLYLTLKDMFEEEHKYILLLELTHYIRLVKYNEGKKREIAYKIIDNIWNEVKGYEY